MTSYHSRTDCFLNTTALSLTVSASFTATLLFASALPSTATVLCCCFCCSYSSWFLKCYCSTVAVSSTATILRFYCLLLNWSLILDPPNFHLVHLSLLSYFLLMLRFFATFAACNFVPALFFQFALLLYRTVASSIFIAFIAAVVVSFYWFLKFSIIYHRGLPITFEDFTKTFEGDPISLKGFQLILKDFLMAAFAITLSNDLFRLSNAFWKIHKGF